MIEYVGSVTNTSKTRKILQFTCGECKLKTNTKEEMDEHVKEHKEMNSDESILREYICKTCEKVFEKEDDYNLHLQIHEDLKTYECDECKLSFTNNDAYKKHKTEKHNPQIVEIEDCTFYCRICAKSFINKEEHDNHVKEHSINCKDCAYKTFSKEDLETHRRIHISLFPQQSNDCQSCPYKTANKEDFKKHQCVKSTEFTCDECEFTVKDINSLVNHKNTIHKVLTYKCDQCPLYANRIEDLWRHKLAEHQDYNFSNPETNFNMQQMFLIGLSSQVEYLVEHVTKIEAEANMGFKEMRSMGNSLGEAIKSLEKRVDDNVVAISKTTRFDTKIQNDNQAVLTRVSEKCDTIETVVTNKIKDIQCATIEIKESVEKIVPAKEEEKSKLKDNNGKKQMTWIGTSISKPLNKEKMEKDLNVDLSVEKAYCISQEKDSNFPNINLKKVVPNVLKRNKPDILVLQAGSVEISNFKVNEALLDTQKSIEKYKEEWFNTVQKNSEELFDIAEEAVKQEPNMKVFIFKRLPRFDKGSADLLRIKSQLSEFGNSVYDQLWIRKGSPDNIQILDFDLGCSEQNRKYLRNIIYGDPNSSEFDGLHLRGEHAERHFNYRAIKAIKPTLSKYKKAEQMKKPRSTSSDPDYHATCPQTIYQREQIAARLRFMRNNQSQQRSYSEAVTGSSQSQRRSYSEAVTRDDQSEARSWVSNIRADRKMPYIYNVPTSNYYQHLN